LERQLDEEYEQQEVINKTGPAQTEMKKIKEILKEQSLTVKDIASDGNCLYSAISHQLNVVNNIQKSFSDLREITSNYMLQHSVDFEPYVCLDDHDCSDFDEYCQKIATTPVWGGELELKAMSDALNITIEVIQANGPKILIGDSKVKDKLIITYHRLMLGAGEHYNSTQTLKNDQDF
jgi:OTU domain-containing protein 6